MRTWLQNVAAVFTLLCASAVNAPDIRANATDGEMKIRIVIDDTELVAVLEDSPSSRSFVAQLPLELVLKDYHGTEKIADLPNSLSTDGATEGIDPEVGDITYFAPWGNLALFYRDFGYSRGLIRLGRIEGSIAALEGKESLSVRIERIDPDG